jgi:hypothetical protein
LCGLERCNRRCPMTMCTRSAGIRRSQAQRRRLWRHLTLHGWQCPLVAVSDLPLTATPENSARKLVFCAFASALGPWSLGTCKAEQGKASIGRGGLTEKVRGTIHKRHRTCAKAGSSSIPEKHTTAACVGQSTESPRFLLASASETTQTEPMRRTGLWWLAPQKESQCCVESPGAAPLHCSVSDHDYPHPPKSVDDNGM